MRAPGSKTCAGSRAARSCWQYRRESRARGRQAERPHEPRVQAVTQVGPRGRGLEQLRSLEADGRTMQPLPERPVVGAASRRRRHLVDYRDCGQRLTREGRLSWTPGNPLRPGRDDLSSRMRDLAAPRRDAHPELIRRWCSVMPGVRRDRRPSTAADQASCFVGLDVRPLTEAIWR
jgi:hypothetical protein